MFLDTSTQSEVLQLRLLQDQNVSGFNEENTIAESQIQTNEKLFPKCGSNVLHIDLIRGPKESKLTKEKTYEKINDEEKTFINSSDIPQVVTNDKELPLTSNNNIEGDQ